MSDPAPDSTAPAPAPAPLALEVTLPPKVKKPRSVKQQEATARALAVLSERREKKKAEMVAVSETKEIAKEVIKKQKKENVEFVTKSDLEGFMATIESKMNSRAAAAPVAAPVAKVLPTAPSQVAKVIQKAPTVAAPVAKLTGHALLDSLFFPGK